jgi:hypothetical protein
MTLHSGVAIAITPNGKLSKLSAAMTDVMGLRHSQQG